MNEKTEYEEVMIRNVEDLQVGDRAGEWKWSGSGGFWYNLLRKCYRTHHSLTADSAFPAIIVHRPRKPREWHWGPGEITDATLPGWITGDVSVFLADLPPGIVARLTVTEVLAGEEAARHDEPETQPDDA